MFLQLMIAAMIKKEERILLKILLGHNYTREVGFLLRSKKVSSRRGTRYSASMIRRVFNGYAKNTEIENAILQVYATRKQRMEENDEFKNTILGLRSEEETNP
ncbi:hypothetical protein N9J39_02310 [Flavicella sp.]|jgi:hypothetical protein|nr:hypothetical protein [Flavicella sp.]|tara:strand:- start:2522 stop:2830 length:309 start_codon:yes stop_codon:yes gene_type:complete